MEISYQLMYIILIAIAALFSQLAQFAHLKYSSGFNLLYAFLFAMSLACFEYMFSVPANRIAKTHLGMTTAQIQLVFFGGMLFFFTLLHKYYFNEKFTWKNLLAYVFVGAGLFLSF
jgi:uncharacterized protein (DUF486 family)